MKHLKTIFACLLMAVLSIGQVWGTDVTTTFANKTSGTWAQNQSALPCDEGGLSWAVSAAPTGFESSGGTNYEARGLTFGSGADPVFTATQSGTISQVVVVASTNSSNTSLSVSVGSTDFTIEEETSISITSGTANANASYTFIGSATGEISINVTNNVSNKTVYIKSITVTYTTGGVTPPPAPSVSVTPTSWNFGTVHASDAASKIFSVSGSNLTSGQNLSIAVPDGYSVDPSSITVSAATLDATNVTVTKNTSTVGNYNGNISITGGGLTSAKTVALQMTVDADPALASLPFSFTGGKDNIASTDGMTQTGLSSDYAGAGVTTKLKFDGTGDNIIIHFNAAPGTLTFDIKGNGFSGGTFKVQESADGNSYTDKYTYSADGNGVEVALSNTARYVKFVYVTKSSGNIGLGNIAISAYVAPASVATPTISGTESFLTSTTVTLGCTTDGATIYYTTDGSDPKTSATKQTGTSFTLTNTATVRAIANKGSDWSNEATQKTFTKITPLTVAEAIELIPNTNDQVNDQYVAGIVCTAAPSLLSGGKLTYFISADGSETNRLQIYKGKNLNNTEFANVSDLAIGDRVVVFGQLKNYSGTKEMNEGNYLVSKEGPAVAAPVFSPDGGGFMGETDVTITCATGSSTIYYTTDGSTTPSKSSTPYTGPIHLNATTTIKAIAYVGEESSLVITKTFTLTAPMTVAEALTALDSENPINNVAVAGIVSTAPTSNPSSGKLTYYISDDGTASDELEVYLGFGLNGASFSNKTDLQVGDEVTVFGNLTIFNSTTKEFSTGSRLIAFNRPTVDLNNITLPATANVKAGKTVTLTPTFDPTNATDKTVSWTSDDELIATVVDGVVTGVAAGTVDITVTYTADPTIKATCAVTVSEAPSFDDPTYEWQLVTSDAQLVADKYYVIGSAQAYTATYESGDYMTAVATTFTDGCISAANRTTAGSTVFKLGGTSAAWTLSEVDGDKQLGATTGLKMNWTDNKTWTISIDVDNNATIANVNTECGDIRYNNSTSPKRYKVYASTSTMPLPQLYVWAEKTNKLRYDANGGEDAPTAQPAVAGEATVTSSIPTYTDKIFVNWNTEIGGTGDPKVTGDVIDLSSADVTLYAQWRDPYDNITISYDANGGSLKEGESAIADATDQVEGTQYTLEANVYEKAGYMFGGWKAYDALDNELTITSNKITVPSTNVTVKAQWISLNITDFILVTNVNQLQNGDKVYIVAAGDRNFAMSTQHATKNYRTIIDIQKTIDKQYIVLPDGSTDPVELTINKVGDDFTFYDGTGYLAAYSNSNNDLVTVASANENDNAKWAITIDGENANASIVAQGDKAKNTLMYNAANSRFSCYSTAQQAIALYKKANYPRAMTDGRFGTICLPNSGIMHGAQLFEVAYIDNTQQKIFFDEVEGGVMIAGRPYIFLKNDIANNLGVVYTGSENASAGNYRGLYGSYSEQVLEIEAGNYVLYNNQYLYVASTSTNVKVGANRAYIKIGVEGGVPTSATAPAPGRRRVSMDVVGAPQVTTGVSELNADETPVKVMIDGQLYIIRGEKMYDATGRLVK